MPPLNPSMIIQPITKDKYKTLELANDTKN